MTAMVPSASSTPRPSVSEHRQLVWVASPTPSSLTANALNRCRNLIHSNTGEEYPLELLSGLPVAPLCGSLLLIPEGIERPQALAENMIHGLLWVMRLDEHTVRILTILVEIKHRSRGYAAEGWRMFEGMARNEGATQVVLEVRAENDIAIGFYQRRGLSVVGRLSHYYQGGEGLAMKGLLRQ